MFIIQYLIEYVLANLDCDFQIIGTDVVVDEICRRASIFLKQTWCPFGSDIIAQKSHSCQRACDKNVDQDANEYQVPPLFQFVRGS